MEDLPFQPDPDWKDVLDALAQIRYQEDYSPANVDFIRQHLGSTDDRVRAAAALTAQGCILEPYLLDAVMEMAEYDENTAVRRAAIQSLATVIHEGVMQDWEDEQGAGTAMDEAEEWEELQSGELREDYQRVKYFLMNLLEDDSDYTFQEVALSALGDLGFLPEVQAAISRSLDSPRRSSQLVALNVMGRYPQYWEDELAALIKPETPVALLKEAISASYSSESGQLAAAIAGVLDHSDPEVLRFALLTLANINKTEGLGEILQRFSLHENSLVQEAARDGIELINKKNFSGFLEDELGMEE